MRFKTDEWFYCVEVDPHRVEKLLKIWYKKELVYQEKMNVRPGESTIMKKIEIVKKGIKK